MALNVAAFDAVIWRAPQRRVAAQQLNAPTRPPPAPKLNLELIAITSAHGESAVSSVRRAALYDPAKDKLYLLVEGDQVNHFTLTVIDADAATFTSGEHVLTLKLRADKAPLTLGRAQR